MLFFTMNLIAAEMPFGGLGGLFGVPEEYMTPEDPECDLIEGDEEEDGEGALKYCSTQYLPLFKHMTLSHF